MQRELCKVQREMQSSSRNRRNKGDKEHQYDRRSQNDDGRDYRERVVIYDDDDDDGYENSMKIRHDRRSTDY